MPHIRIYRFKPKSKPPTQIHKLFPWFKKEVTDASIEPVAVHEFNNDGLLDGGNGDLSLVKRLFKGWQLLKKALDWMKENL